MYERLDMTLQAIGNEYADRILPSSRIYLEIDIGQTAKKLGLSEIEKRYSRVLVVVPLKKAERGMTVRIDGRTFINYGQLDSGVVVPGSIAKKCNLTHKNYIPNDSMILNFA